MIKISRDDMIGRDYYDWSIRNNRTLVWQYFSDDWNKLSFQVLIASKENYEAYLKDLAWRLAEAMQRGGFIF